MRHVMVDLETMGTRAGSAIVSIGAVQFDPTTGKLGQEFYVNVDLQSCLDAGLRIDGSTVMWWLRQSDDARQALDAGGALSLKSALALYSEWLSPLALVWAHGASFDHALLAEAYHAVALPRPIPYHQERDTRTIFDLTGVRIVKSIGTHHNALDDAKTQALAVIKAYKKLGEKS